MITKQDWEVALKQYEAMLINTQVALIAQEQMVAIIVDKIKAYPDEDPMPKDVKEAIKGVK